LRRAPACGSPSARTAAPGRSTPRAARRKSPSVARAHVTRCHEVSPAAPGRRARGTRTPTLPWLALSELLVAHDHHRARRRLDALVEHAAATEEFAVPAVLEIGRASCRERV